MNRKPLQDTSFETYILNNILRIKDDLVFIYYQNLMIIRLDYPIITILLLINS